MSNLLRWLMIAPVLPLAWVLSSSSALAELVQSSDSSAIAPLAVPSSAPIMPPPSSSSDISPAVALPRAQTTQVQLERYAIEGSANAAEPQITSVTALSDVQPTDWAYQSLQSLVERYGCIIGYPDRTYRGNRPLSRYEFAAGLNACLDRVNELIAQGTAGLVTKEDLAILQRLQEEFAAELATLRGRIDSLEARTATLEAQQFSTTTKLGGQAIFALGSLFAGDDAGQQELNRTTTLGYRVRLEFDTSFTGDDLLRTRLQVGNFSDFAGNAANPFSEGSIRFATGPADANQVQLDALLYQFPVGDRTVVTIEANAGASDDFADTINPFIDGDGGSGALTNFGTRNPIYYYIDGNGGIGIQHNLSDQFTLSAGYIAAASEGTAPGNGLFGGPYGAIGQLTFQPSDRVQIGLYYIHAYNNDPGGTGSNNANLVATTGQNVVTNSYGVGFSFQFSRRFVLNAWGGYTAARVIGAGDAKLWNFAVNLAFPDLGGKGNLGGIIVGMEPKVTSVDGVVLSGLISSDPSTSIHVEAFYTLQLSDNIAITPTVIWLTAPNHDNRNEDLIMGLVRTTFTF